MRRALVSKKILVATLGAASVTYAACAKDPSPDGASALGAARSTPGVGNLPAPVAPDASDAIPPVPSASVPPRRHLVGNLMPMPMPEPDAGGAPKKPQTP